MVHGVRIRDGNAEWYRFRYVHTPFIGNPGVGVLDPAVIFDMKASKANTDIVGHAGPILALEEDHVPDALDGEPRTIGAADFNGALKGTCTAHPGEFSRVAASVNGSKHRYGYLIGMSDNPDSDPMSASGVILKYDRQTGVRTAIALGRGCSPGEPVFAAPPASVAN